MFTNRCKTEDHLIDPDATAQDSAQALLAEAPALRPFTKTTAAINRWTDAVERMENTATTKGKLDFSVLANLLRAELLAEMTAHDALKAKK